MALLPMPVGAQHIAYAPLEPSQTIAMRAAAVRPTPYIDYAALDAVDTAVWRGNPRLSYAALPVDDRIAPAMLFSFVDAGDQDVAPAPPPPRVEQDYTPRPALWRIGDKDTTIWLFGTVHVLPPGFKWRDGRIDAVTRRARALIVEAIDTNAPPNFQPGPNSQTEKYPSKLPPLLDRVSPDHKNALERQQAAMPLPAVKLMDGMPTWMAAIAIGFTRDVHAGQASGPGADDGIETQFRAASKPVTAIEDGAAVMKSLNATPEAQQRKMLDQALDEGPKTEPEKFAAVHAWAKGDLTALATELGKTEDPLSKPLMQDRNRAWTDALVRRLKRPGTVLFAAGAAHFVGADSVIAQLRKRGIKVTRVP